MTNCKQSPIFVNLPFKLDKIIRNKITYNNSNIIPAKKILRKIGILSDQEGIMRRYLHEFPNWDEHLSKTKQFIVEYISKHKFKSVSILGSGWLLDVPIRFLSEEMDEVIFYDVFHPAEIKHKFGKRKNFLFVEADLTGGLIDKTYNLCKEKNSLSEINLLSAFSTSELMLPFTTECYISLNLLNQLDIILLDYLRQHFDLTEAMTNQLRGKVQQTHVQFLQQHNFCLITDYEEMLLGNDDQINASKELIFTQLPPCQHQAEWVWKFDTHKTYNNDQKTYMKVKALF